MLTALKEFLSTHKVTELTTDNGTEFLSATAQKLFEDSNVEYFNNEAGDHNKMSKIERFNRTIKQRLIRMEHKLTLKLLADVIHNYNTTENSAIGQSPEEAEGTVDRDALDHNEEAMNSLDDKLTIGDSVRYRLTKGTFAKEGARWRKDVYRYEGLDGYKADIRSKNGHIKYVPLNDLKVVNAKATNAEIAPQEVMEIDKNP